MRPGYRDLLIALFAIGIVIGLVFGGGVVLGRNSAPQATPIAAAGGAGGGAATAGSPTAAAGVGQNVLAGQTIGTVTSVEGDAFTVRGLNGQTSIMAESLSTRITNSVPGTATDVRPGALVAVVPGPPDSQGRTIATTVLILPPTLAPAGGGGAAGAAQGGASGASGARPSATPSAAAGGPGAAGVASATPQR